jgi:hypothetical protein
MTSWPDHLDRVGELLDEAEGALAAGDLDTAAGYLERLADEDLHVGLPPLTAEHAGRARDEADRLARVEVQVLAVLRRLRPELALVAGAGGERRATSLFVDEPA